MLLLLRLYWDICVYINAIETAVYTIDSMAPSALLFEPSYTTLKNLHQKIYDCTTTSVTLPIRPENLATDLRPYLDNAIVTLSTSTAYLRRERDCIHGR